MAINYDLVTEVSPNQRMLKDQVEYHWLVGCTPTAVTMLLGYWDRNGYDNLIEGESGYYSEDVKKVMASSEHYRDYADPNDGSSASVLPDNSRFGELHENNSVADFLYTSRSNLGLKFGWSLYGTEGLGVHGWANHRGYDDFVTKLKHWGSFSFQTVADEIDAGRPVILSVDSNADGINDHNVVVFGYDSAQNKLLIHDGWERTSETRWIDFTYAKKGHPFGIVSATTVKPGDAEGSDGAIDFMHIEDDNYSTAALYQDTLLEDGTFATKKISSNTGAYASTTRGVATGDGHIFYQLYDDGVGSVSLYRAVAYGDGQFRWFRLSSDSGLGDRTIDFATSDGRVFYQLYDDGSGTAAIYKSTRQEDGTFTAELLNVNSGLSRNTISLSTADGETFYQLVDDGSGTAALYKGTLNADGSFAMTLVSNDSNVSRKTVGGVAWQTPELNLPEDGEVFDDPNVEQYLFGTGDNDVFVISGKSTDYNWNYAEDGKGILIWNNEGFDIVWDFEAIRFNDKTIDLTADKIGQMVIKDTKGQTDYLFGTAGNDIFVIDGQSSDYNWTYAEDGKGILIWNEQGFDIVWDFETIQFTDKSIDLTADVIGQMIIKDTKGQSDYLFGTKGEDVFVIDGQSTDYNWNYAEDGKGILIWNSEGFDIVWDFETLRFNDRDIDLTADKVGQIVAKDIKGQTDYLSGSEGTDIFVMDADRADFNIEKTVDGTGVVIWNNDSVDMLWDFEEIKFNDETVIIQDELA
ncbi:MAG: C39 family peptidase [Cohaesibacter sp.]|jgi:hypothetical protein|nr:C39 family peptidase [Cohaesibacter sp.]